MPIFNTEYKSYYDRTKEYQEVEYIKSSGTQYINTGLVPTNNTKIELSMGGRNQISTYNDLFGARYDWSNSGRGFHLGHNGDNGQYYGMFGGAYAGTSFLGLTFSDGNNHIIEMSQSGLYEDGTLKKSLSSVSFTSPCELVLFALNGNGSVDSNGEFKIFYAKLYNSGTLVKNFIPGYIKKTGVIGLRDEVEGKFYVNQGSGNFTKGPDVN